jgi:OmpA-OmpF porin, OOP family
MPSCAKTMGTLVLVLLTAGGALAQTKSKTLEEADSKIEQAFSTQPEKPAGEAAKQDAAAQSKETAVKESRLRFCSAAPGGEIGLINVMEASGCEVGTMRLSFHIGFFSSDSFLKTNKDWADYSESQVIGKLGLSYTVLPYLEVFANLRNASNKNSASKPTLLQTQGDLEFGAKGFYRVLPYLNVGLDLGFGFVNGIGEVTPQLNGTRIRTDLLGSFDMRPLMPQIPLRAHLNVGMIWENSSNLKENRQLSTIEEYALNVSRYNRAVLGIGIDAPLPYAEPFAIVPFVEYSMQFPLGIGDSALKQSSMGQDTTFANVMTILVTPGVRATYLKDLTLDVAVDIGIGGSGGGEKAYLSGVPSTPPYTVWIGLSYAWDPFHRGGGQIVEKEKIIEKVIEKQVTAAPAVGRVAGRVENAADKTPIANAIISFEGGGITPVATDELEGRYATYDLTPGLVKMSAKKEGYKTVFAEAEVKANEIATLDFSLESEVKKGTINGAVSNDKDQPVTAKVDITGPAEFHLNTAADTGAFAAETPAGKYTVKVTADGYLAKGRNVEIKENQTLVAEFKLTPAPKQTIVVIERNKIVVQKKIHFETAKAKLTVDSYTILDSVVDTLVNHPEIKKVRIEGHTDSQGSKVMNTKLSQDRANAVREYLIQQGISAEKLDAQGFGPDKPIAPNSTLRGREQNRRVEFVILDQ